MKKVYDWLTLVVVLLLMLWLLFGSVATSYTILFLILTNAGTVVWAIAFPFVLYFQIFVCKNAILSIGQYILDKNSK